MKSLLALAMLAASVGAAHAYTAGDWVLARWKGGDYWFPGVIQSVADGKIHIKYDDGDVEILGAKSVRPYDWKIGSRVECNFKGTGWYAGKITALGGESLSIAYDDGDKENTKTGKCRSN